MEIWVTNIGYCREVAVVYEKSVIINQVDCTSSDNMLNKPACRFTVMFWIESRQLSLVLGCCESVKAEVSECSWKTDDGATDRTATKCHSLSHSLLTGNSRVNCTVPTASTLTGSELYQLPWSLWRCEFHLILYTLEACDMRTSWVVCDRFWVVSTALLSVTLWSGVTGR